MGGYGVGVGLWRPSKLIVVLAASLLVASCSQAETDPYAAEFAQAAAAANSDFEREAFSDGELTRTEYEEAHELWLACMESTFPPSGGKVVSLSADDDGFYSFMAVGFEPGDEQFYDQVAATCSVGTIDIVAPLYTAMTSNPEKVDPFIAVVACLKRHGLVDESYTVDNLQADMAASSGAFVTQVTDANTGESVFVTEPPPDVDPALVTGLDYGTDEVLNCQLDPES